jgi:hypothetical protein
MKIKSARPDDDEGECRVYYMVFDSVGQIPTAMFLEQEDAINWVNKQKPNCWIDAFALKVKV